MNPHDVFALTAQMFHSYSDEPLRTTSVNIINIKAFQMRTAIVSLAMNNLISGLCSDQGL